MTRILEFTIGAKIHCQDGPAGSLRYVVLDPHSRRVTDIIAEKGFLQKDDRVLPVSIVERATATDVYLAIPSAELTHYPVYRDVEFESPAPGWEPGSSLQRQEIRHWANRYGVEGALEPVIPRLKQHQVQGISSDLATIGRNTPLRNHEGMIGRIDHVLIDRDTQDISHLVVQKGIMRHSFIVPVDWVEDVDESGITIRGGRDELQQLRPYTPRSAVDLLNEVESELHAAPFDSRRIDTSVDQGVVQMRGVVSDVAAKRDAERVARAVPGVIDVDDKLDTGSAIVARVTAALESDPRTHLAVIEVINEHGVVTLSGDVESTTVHEAAEAIAAAQPGVMAVINALEVRPHDELESWANSFAGVRLVTP